MYPLTYLSFARGWRRARALSAQALAAELGWESASVRDLHKGAVQASLAFLGMGIAVPGTAEIKAGPWSGRRVFKGGDAMADWLSAQHEPPHMLSLKAGWADVGYQLFGRRGLLIARTGNPASGLVRLSHGGNGPAIGHDGQGFAIQDVCFWPF